MEQKIAVWIDESSDMNFTQKCGIELAHILKKDLLFIQIANKKLLQETQKELEKKTNNFIDSKQFKYDVEYYVCEDSLENNFDFLANEKEVLAYVFSKKQGRTMLPKLKKSPTPFLFIDENSDITNWFSNIIVPVGYMAKAKDTALWASYIARYNKAKVTLLAATEDEDEDQHEVNSHIHSIENLYEKFGFGFEVKQVQKPTWRIQEHAVNYAKGNKAGLLILAGSQQHSILERLLPLAEKTMLKNSGNIPILFVNSQRDMYVLCG